MAAERSVMAATGILSGLDRRRRIPSRLCRRITATQSSWNCWRRLCAHSERGAPQTNGTGRPPRALGALQTQNRRLVLVKGKASSRALPTLKRYLRPAALEACDKYRPAVTSSTGGVIVSAEQL